MLYNGDPYEGGTAYDNAREILEWIDGIEGCRDFVNLQPDEQRLLYNARTEVSLLANALRKRRNR